MFSTDLDPWSWRMQRAEIMLNIHIFIENYIQNYSFKGYKHFCKRKRYRLSFYIIKKQLFS